MSVQSIQSGGPSIGQMLDVAGSGKSIDEMLEALGLVEHDRDHPNPEIPFQAFFFLTFAVFGQIHQKESLDNMDKLAKDLQDLVGCVNAITSFKECYLSWNDPWGQSQGQTLDKLRNVVEKLNELKHLFPEDVVTRIQNITNDLTNDINLNWYAVVRGRTPQGGDIETMEIASRFMSKISELQSITTGVSGTQTSKMQFNQNNYNQMMAFYKEMLNYWSSMKKASNSAMAQAKS